MSCQFRSHRKRGRERPGRSIVMQKWTEGREIEADEERQEKEQSESGRSDLQGI